jgi:death-on-curing protein
LGRAVARFEDRNKRVGFLTAVVCLGLNGLRLDADEAEVVAIVRAVAAGQATEGAVAKWIRRTTVAS